MDPKFSASFRYHRQQGRSLARAKELACDDCANNRTRYPRAARVARLSDGPKVDPTRAFWFGAWQDVESLPRFNRHPGYSGRAYYVDEWPFRHIGPAHEVRMHGRRLLDHTGYFKVDDDPAGGLMVGHVLQLPGKDGQPCYIPGVEDSDSDGVTVFPLDMHTDLAECVRAADYHASRIASDERDYNAAWQQGSKCADLESQAAAIRSDIMLATSDLRAARRAAAEVDQLADSDSLVRLCARVRRDVADLVAELREVRRNRDRVRDEWRTLDGFAEGYGVS